MIIKELKLTNYRNIDEMCIQLNPSTNIFYGNNAQGKTNIIEGLSFLSLLKSFRNSDIRTLTKIGEEYAMIEIISDYGRKFKVVINKDKKKCFINDNPVSKLSDFIGIINVVVFSPENVNLFKDSPGERRDFLDDELSKLSPSYYLSVLDYKEAKRQRNELLKNDNPDKDLLEALTKQLANYSLQIVLKRKEFIEELNKEISLYYQKLTGTTGKTEIKYKSDFLDIITTKDIFEKMMRNINEDISRRQTIMGIHRDDIVLTLDGLPISEFGSQAQNRLSVVSLKLSTLKIVKEKTGDDPIVVLDDVLSELDSEKQEKLLLELKLNNQLFITSANNIEINNDSITKFEVIQGKARRI